jgi:hypothetical protein
VVLSDDAGQFDIGQQSLIGPRQARKPRFRFPQSEHIVPVICRGKFMNKSVVAIIAVAAVAGAAGGGYAWVMHEGQVALDQATSQIRAGLGPNGSFSYASADVHPFQRTAELGTVALRAPWGALFTADRVVIVSNGEGKLASIHASGVRASRSASDGTATAASLDGKDIAFPAPAAGQPFKVDPSAVTFNDLTLHDVAFAQPGTSAKVASLDVRDYGAGRPSTLMVSDFSVPVPDADGIDHAGFATLTASGVDLATAVHAFEHDSKMPQLSAGAVAFEMDGFYVANGSDRPVLVQKALISGSASADGGSSSANVEISGVSFVPTDAASKARFVQVGLTKLDGSLSSTISYRIAGGAFEMSPTLNVDGFGTLALGIKLAHLDTTAFADKEPNLSKLLAIANATQLVSAHANFVDGGLLDFALDKGARGTGMSKEQLRAQGVASVGEDPNLDVFPNSEQTREALASFIAHGGHIDVMVQPRSPVSVMQLIQVGESDPGTFVQLVGLSITGG